MMRPALWSGIVLATWIGMSLSLSGVTGAFVQNININVESLGTVDGKPAYYKDEPFNLTVQVPLDVTWSDLNAHAPHLLLRVSVPSTYLGLDASGNAEFHTYFTVIPGNVLVDFDGNATLDSGNVVVSLVNNSVEIDIDPVTLAPGSIPASATPSKLSPFCFIPADSSMLHPGMNLNPQPIFASHACSFSQEFIHLCSATAHLFYS